MKTPRVRILTLITGLVAAFSIVTSASAAPLAWPFGESRSPRDPALALLAKIDTLKVSLVGEDENNLLVKIEIEAATPYPGFTDLTLVGRPGKLNDRIFAFEARGRPPQRPNTDEAPETVSIGGTYEGAPIASVNVVEVFAKENCLAYSLAEKKEVPCTTRVLQDEEM
ncbi:hypothetical protein V6C03_12090 [Methyloligella sp. 2.7D]|uniref:hypothetical protein n=1 Tax=unclassified Methyloligella TaxID=2625955 RepID=UPI00157D0651|nr:hypothetical protein [Methyloligella sp. GL2]QKP77463.1 hypothetical protein HT051_08370 [Methyloligella sp. GL2]